MSDEPETEPPKPPDLLAIARQVASEMRRRIPPRLMEHDEIVNESWIAAKIAVSKCPTDTLDVGAYAAQSARYHMARIAKREKAHDRRFVAAGADDNPKEPIDRRAPDLCSIEHIDHDDRMRIAMNPSDSVAVLFHEFFGSLPDRLKQPAYLSFVRGLTVRDIADDLKISKSTAQRRLKEAVQASRDNASKKLWDKSGELTQLLMGTDRKTTNPRKTDAAV